MKKAYYVPFDIYCQSSFPCSVASSSRCLGFMNTLDAPLATGSNCQKSPLNTTVKFPKGIDRIKFLCTSSSVTASNPVLYIIKTVYYKQKTIYTKIIHLKELPCFIRISISCRSFALIIDISSIITSLTPCNFFPILTLLPNDIP